jgi:hypothetical protein
VASALSDNRRALVNALGSGVASTAGTSKTPSAALTDHTGTGTVVTIKITTHALATGDYIALAGWTWSAGINGAYKVTFVDADHVSILQTSTGNPTVVGTVLSWLASANPIILALERVHPGWHSRIDPDNAESLKSMHQDVIDNGPCASVGTTKNIAVDDLGYGWQVVTVNVFISKNKATSWDGYDLDDFISSLLTAAINRANYIVVGMLSMFPRMAGGGLAVYDREHCEGLVILEFTVELPDPIDVKPTPMKDDPNA